MPKKKQLGFTLIELLIVIAIIAILVVFLFVSFTQVQKNARDAQRKSDLQTLAGAFQRFYSDNGHFPGSNPAGEITYNSSTCDNTGVISAQSWTSASSNIVCSKSYLKALPNDPQANPNYCYVSTSPWQTYNLYARLEGTGNIANTACGSAGVTNYNYRVTAND